MRLPPVPQYKRNVKELERVYQQARQELTWKMSRVEPEDLVQRAVYQEVLNDIDNAIRDLNRASRVWIEGTVKESFEYAQASSLVSMGLAVDIRDGLSKLSRNELGLQRLDALIDDTFEDVLKAHSQMSASMKKMVRETHAEVLRHNVALQRGSVTGAKALKTEFLKKGFSKTLVDDNWNGIVDAGGRRWDLTVYTKMVARTKLQQAQIEGAIMTSIENDSDLAIISSHGAKDACRHFEGMVISLTGRTRGYLTLDEVRASGLIFHPNCQHSVHPIGDLEALPPSLRDKANKAQANAESAMSNSREILKADNARRYQEKKEKAQKLKEQRRKALEKARKARSSR